MRLFVPLLWEKTYYFVGRVRHAYLNFLDKGKVGAYWANTSSNSLVGKLLRESHHHVKEQFEVLLQGECIWVPVDEQIVYSQLDQNESAIWSLLLAKVHDPEDEATLEDTVAAALKQIGEKRYDVQLIERSIPAERIRSYGFAFEGKNVLIGSTLIE